MAEVKRASSVDESDEKRDIVGARLEQKAVSKAKELSFL